MEPSDVVKMEYKELADWTDNFSEKNYIGRFQYGKLYRGEKNLADMIVKIWEVPETCSCTLEDNELRLMDELIFLRHQLWNRHPGIPWIFGYCFDGVHVGAVYELESNPLDSFFNLIPKEGFSWVQRIKAALELSALLKFLHTEHGSFCPPIVINNLDAAHLLLDEEYRVKLCDFGWITGGIFPATRLCLGNDTIGCYGYTDVDSSCSEQFSNKQDVFAFGVILLSLISKRVCTGEDRDAGVPFVYEWARRESEAFESESNMKDTNFSLVHESLAVDDGFWFDDGHKVTKLALECVNKDESQRPDVEKIFEFISRLKVVKQNSAFFKPSEKLRRSEVLWRRAREMKLGSRYVE